MQPYYPAIDDPLLTPFRALQAQLEQFPDLLTRAECPYTPEIREFLAALFAAEVKSPLDDLDLEDLDNLEGQITDLYKRINRFSAGIEKNDKDALTFFRASAGLLEKMVSMRQAVFSAKNHSEFQTRIMDVMDNVLTAEQRSEFVEKLGKFAND